MLREGWRRGRGGLIAIDEVPPAARERPIR
jgi:hypothetical protein